MHAWEVIVEDDKISFHRDWSLNAIDIGRYAGERFGHASRFRNLLRRHSAPTFMLGEH